MAKFVYKLVSKNDKILEGRISAFSKGRAAKILTKDGATVLFLKREGSTFFLKRISLPRFGMSGMERILFFRNLSSMSSAGVSLVHGLEVLQKQGRSGGVKRAIATMISDIRNGQKLSAALKKFPRYFSQFLVELVNVGETSGELNETLEQISIDLERNYELRRKVVNAITYPLVVVFVMLLVVVGLVTFVLPKIAELYQELHAPLPFPTSFLFSASLFIQAYPFLILAAFFVFVLVGFLIWRSQKGRYLLHYLLLKLPIFGELVKEFNLARLFRSLQILLASGISLVASVQVAKNTLRNRPYQKVLNNVYPVLLYGSPLSEVLQHYPFLFPEQAQRMVEVGERTGNIEQTFRHITRHYENMVNHKTQMLTALTEPVLMVIIGAVVGGLALSIFLPIYQVSNVI